MKTGLILCGLCLSFSVGMHAEPDFVSTGCLKAVILPPESYTLSVRVKVDGPQPEAGRAESYLRHKLAEDHDKGNVIFSDNDAPFILNVSLWRATNNASTTLSLIATSETGSKEKDHAKKTASEEVAMVITGAPGELKPLCERIASDFDRRVLELARRRHQIEEHGLGSMPMLKAFPIVLPGDK